MIRIVVVINRTGNKIELSNFLVSKNVCNAPQIWEAEGYTAVNPLDIENRKEIQWEGIEFNRLISKSGVLYRFNGWLGPYPYNRGIQIEEIGTIR